MPLAPGGYKFYRNVKDYGAKVSHSQSHYGSTLMPNIYRRAVLTLIGQGDGKTDDTDAINRAASEGNRCGQGCAGTSTLGALVYFPVRFAFQCAILQISLTTLQSGTYLVKKPIVQYYYTQFVGDPNDRPVLKADDDFKGIAIFDTDPYIPGAKGAQW
jgi:glucan 1,3-beta-glucosidase